MPADEFSICGPFPFQIAGVSDAARINRSSRLTFTGTFTTMSEDEMYLYPTAHALLEAGYEVYGLDDGYVSSERINDLGHGITVIGDGTAPECMVSVNGAEYEKLSLCDITNIGSGHVVDRRYEDVNIDLYVIDSGSGLRGNFEVYVINLDNGMEGRFASSGEHCYLRLKQDPDCEEPSFDNKLFNGKIVIRVCSEDNVGNRGTEESAGLIELDVSGEIVRTLDTVTGPLIDDEGRHYIKRGNTNVD